MSNNTFDEVGQMFYDRVRSRAEAAEQRARELEQQLKEVKGSLYATEARVKELEARAVAAEADVVALQDALLDLYRRAEAALQKPHPGQPLLDRIAELEAEIERLRRRTP